MPTQIGTASGKAHLVGLPISTAKCYAPTAGMATELFSGYVMPNVSSVSLTHSGTSELVKSSSGEYTGIIITGEVLKCSFDIVPEGSSIANAGKAASIPPFGAAFDIRGLPVVAAGTFSDAFNVSNSGTAYLQNRWIYIEGASCKMNNDTRGSMTIELHRFPSITGLEDPVLS